MKRPIRTSSWHLSGRYDARGGKRAQRHATKVYKLRATQIIGWLEAVGLLGDPEWPMQLVTGLDRPLRPTVYR